RQPHLTALTIPRWRLAQFRGCSPHAKQVITHLKSYTQSVTCTAQAFDSFLVLRSQHRSHLCGTSHQRRCFAADHIYVCRDRDILAFFKANIEVLSLAEDKTGVVERRAKTGGSYPLHDPIQYSPALQPGQSE